ncbi:MAG: nodulation protein NodH [Rhodobacteraceae bacterium]|nr:nodulation protein NodH [Paracoccaceae bacterium]
MTRRFDSFVILAEMRTGSNLLEATLAQASGVNCHGEVFNPAHLGGPKVKTVLGMTMADRIADPEALWRRIIAEPGLNGIRYFHDHEPRVLDGILNDPRCAKIVLTRNPVDCYVSLKIATATKKWRLGNVKDSVTRQIAFNEEEFGAFLAARQAFQLRVQRALQVSGQTAFYLDYDAVQDVGVINGLLGFLGSEGRIDSIADSLVRQNPEALEDKVRNYPEMEAALSRVDWADLGRSPHFEPRRGAGIPRVVAAKGAPLLYFPIGPFDDTPVRMWLSRLGGGGLDEGFTQKTLRAWKRTAVGHRSFAVLRHPVPRALDAFAMILRRDTDAELRSRLRKHYRVPIPEEDGIAEMGSAQFRDAFRAFLGFVKVNLAGQTGVATYPVWGTQWAQLEGISGFVPPDLLCREDRLEEDLARLAAAVGAGMAPLPPPAASQTPFPAEEVCDREIELLAREVYRRDYVSFGFGDWR